MSVKQVLFLGLEGSGKTSLLHQIEHGDFALTNPTHGFSVTELGINGTLFKCIDVGGSAKDRAHWPKYFDYAHAVVFVIDSRDTKKLQAASKEIQKVLDADALKDAALLFVANKQDQPNSLSGAEVAEELGLDGIHIHKWQLQEASAVDGVGLYEGLEWLEYTLQDPQYVEVTTTKTTFVETEFQVLLTVEVEVSEVEVHEEEVDVYVNVEDQEEEEEAEEELEEAEAELELEEFEAEVEAEEEEEEFEAEVEAEEEEEEEEEEFEAEVEVEEEEEEEEEAFEAEVEAEEEEEQEEEDEEEQVEAEEEEEEEQEEEQEEEFEQEEEEQEEEAEADYDEE